AENKVYDGTTAATLATGSASLSGIIAGDTVAIDGSSTTAAFGDKNVGTGKLVTITGLGLTGADAGNYTVTSSASAIADITPRALTASGVVADHKVYDGTTAATLSFAGFDGGGIVAGDDVHLGDYIASFADKNVGTAKTVTVSGLGLTGADAGNYTFTAPSTFAADITPKALSLTGVIANDKVYDGTTAASLTITGPGLTGIVDGDTVALNSGSATAQFADKNAGADKTVLVAGLGLLGADAGNYTLGESGGLTASITPEGLTVIANDQSRTYGDANPQLSVSYNGFVAGENAGNSLDQLAVANTTAEQTSNVGTYAITASGAVAAHGNYTITYVNGALTVTPRSITLSADPASKIFGTADPALSLSLIDGSLAAGDTLDSVTGLLTREAGEAAGLYDILLGEGSRAGNYAITFNADNDAFSITLPPRLGPMHAAGSLVADQRRNDWPDALFARDGAELVEPGLYEWRKDWRLLVAESLGRGDSAGQLADNVLHRIDRLVERSGFSSNNVQWREESL
ncbi:MAG TPA: YDG domain-containing protein, partial [Candidatus Synoicihabitans sp.]|nr:YDG domain-containing protein [Candidatus Synoicihabitans sp.]